MNNATNGQAENQDGATVDQQIREKEDAEFTAKLKDLQAQYKRVLVPIIDTSKFGIFPSLRVVTEDEYSSIMGRLGFQPAAPVEQPKG